MSWQKYYVITMYEETLQRISAGKITPPRTFYFIDYSPDNEKPGEPAYDVGYRTYQHAVRGAERLYKRMHGAMEDAVFGPEK